MEPITFKEAVCNLYGIHPEKFERFMLRKTLFWRVRFLQPLIEFFHPDFLFNERRLVSKIANAHNMREVQEEVDFYQHKFVVGFVLKEVLRFRISGMRIMIIARKAFQEVIRQRREQAEQAPAPEARAQ